MHFFNLILTGVIVIYMQTYYNIVSCQNVSMLTSGEVNHLKDKLKLGCSPSQVSMWSFVSHITISKNTSTGFQDIVTVFLNFTSFRNETVWNQQAWQHRATIIKEYVNPLINHGIEFDIKAEKVLCSDEGTYRCTVIGTTVSYQSVQFERTGTVELLVKPTTINQIEVSPKPQIDELYKPNTLIELSCTGTVGRNPAGELRWCYRRHHIFDFIGWPNPDDYDNGTLFPVGCQNSRTSILKYNVSAVYRYTEFRCETGGITVVCGHPSAISSNITVYRYTEPQQSTTYDEPTDSSSDNWVSKERNDLIIYVEILYLLVNG